MTSTKAFIGRGTKVRVAPIRDRIIPEKTTFTTTTEVSENTAELPVSSDFTKSIFASFENPVYLNFIEPSGRQHLVEVVGDIIPQTFSATQFIMGIKPINRKIAAGSIAQFPLILSKRTSANLTDQDATTDVMTFENDGWKDSITTMLGNGLELPGYYDPLDAGWNTCYSARLKFGEIYWELELPAPEGYQKGHIIRGFGGVQMPLEVPSDNIINANITINSRGPVDFVEPVPGLIN